MSTPLAFGTVALLFALIAPVHTLAGERQQPQPQPPVYQQVVDPQGFIVAVPKWSRQALISDLSVATRRLDSRRAYLSEKTKKPLGIGHAISVVVVPGGLLYGAYKVHQWTLARGELAALQEQIHHLRADAARLGTVGYGEQVALASPP